MKVGADIEENEIDHEQRWDGQPRDSNGRFDNGSKGGKKFKVSRKEKSSEKLKRSDKGVEKSNNSGIIKENLTKRDIQAINKYISSDSYKVNEKLRSGLKLSSEEEQFAKDLDIALDKMPKYKGTVYRSLSSDMMSNIDKFKKLHQTGNIVKYDAYTSSSLEVYDDTMDIQCIIQSKNGRNITDFNSNEQEILFKRNTAFKIINIENNIIYMEEF